jgi:hypothetical protein
MQDHTEPERLKRRPRRCESALCQKSSSGDPANNPPTSSIAHSVARSDSSLPSFTT